MDNNILLCNSEYDIHIKDHITLYIINLPYRKKRLESTLNELKKIEFFSQIEIKIIDACTPSIAEKYRHFYFTSSAIENINKKKNYSHDILPTWGAAGCALSHSKCWEEIKKNEKDIGLVLEDDILIKNIDNFKINFIKAYRNISSKPTKNTMILFNASYTPNTCNYFPYWTEYYYPQYNNITNYMNNYTNTYHNNEYLQTHYSILSCTDLEHTELTQINNAFTKTHCYLINKRCADFLLSKVFPIKYQIDIQLGLVAKKYNNLLSIFNIPNSDIIQNNKFISDNQVYRVEKQFLIETFNFLNNDIIENVYKYIKLKEYRINNRML